MAGLVVIGSRKTFWIIQLGSEDPIKNSQLIINKDILPKVSVFSTIYYEGIIVRSPKGDTNEIHVTKILFYGSFPPEKLKIGWKTSEVKLRSLVSQRLLTRKYQGITTCRSDISLQLLIISKALHMNRIFSPFITFSDCEGAGETFEVKSSIEGFFKRTAFLTVSGQVDEETATSRMLLPTFIFGP